MHIEQWNHQFVIVKGHGLKTTFFSFFVDSDKDSWSGRLFNARVYSTRELAEEDLEELRRRAKVRSKELREKKEKHHGT
jgi:hypothetical protein